MRPASAFAVVIALFAFQVRAEDELWIITTPMVIDEPMDVGDVIIAGAGSLTVRGLPEPGLRVSGNLWAIGDSELRLEGSVIQFMSEYHGQYALAAAERASVEVIDCDYRVPNGVQHALVVAGEASMIVEDTDFGDVQLLSADTSTLAARRLNGNFEVLVQHDSTMVLTDIPRVADQGRIWVWVEFPDGSVADYTPPMPGLIDSWSFPPPGATGIEQTATVTRCETLLWPILVREGSNVTLRDIPEDQWIVVGFHMPGDATIEGLVNDTTYVDHTLDLEDRVFRLVDASIDTWNLYPQADAEIVVRDSHLGEILSLENSRVRMERTTVDGTGGFFGARSTSRMIAVNCIFTCTIEATNESTIELRSSVVRPTPADPTGQWTRFGAFDEARLFADQTAVFTRPALAGRGLIAVSSIHDPPDAPPGPGEEEVLVGSVGLYSLDEAVSLGRWRIQASSRAGRPEILAAGNENTDDAVLGVWAGRNSTIDHRIQTFLTDGLGRTLVGNIVIPGTGGRTR